MTAPVVDLVQLVARLREEILMSRCSRVRGGGSKPVLSAGVTIDVAVLDGVPAYDAQEITFAALAGTPLR